MSDQGPTGRDIRDIAASIHRLADMLAMYRQAVLSPRFVPVDEHPCPGCQFRNRMMAVAFVLCVVFTVLGAVAR